jgi:hypothetical protein
MANSKRLDDLLLRLAAAEERFYRSEFLAPMVQGGRVHVRTAGVVCCFKVRPAHFAGWGVFLPTATNAAKLVRAATAEERRRYLDLLPRVRLLLAQRDGKHWLGRSASQGDRRIPANADLSVYLAEAGQPFARVECRFDGAQCWFDAPDPRGDPDAAQYLRDALVSGLDPGQVARPGLTAEERTLYAHLYQCRSLTWDDVPGQLRRSVVPLASAGERAGGREARREAPVLVAGICLASGDALAELCGALGTLRRHLDVDEHARVGPDEMP